MVGEDLKKVFLEMGLTLSVAESCTGGYISHLITSVPGSSNYFKGGIVAYWEEIKVNILGISKEIIERHTVFSPQVAIEMAKGISRLFSTDVGISSTGIAGPTGGLPLRPVGTVFLGFKTPFGVFSKKLKLSGERGDIIRRASEEALKTLLETLIGRKISNRYTKQAMGAGRGKIPKGGDR